MRHTTLVFAAVVLACSSSRSGGDALVNPDVLTEDEVRASVARNAYELVEQERPRWLRPGPDRSLRLNTVILVYFDGLRLGGVDTLRNVELGSIHSLRVLDGSQAGHLPGLGSQHVERVILISSRTTR